MLISNAIYDLCLLKFIKATEGCLSLTGTCHKLLKLRNIISEHWRIQDFSDGVPT